jgi:alpha-1,3-rhamnosyl/mannosyltransferase
MSESHLSVGYDISSIFGRNGIARYSRELLLQMSQRADVSTHLVGTRNQRDELLSLFHGTLPVDTELSLTHERALGAPLRRLVRLWKAREIRGLFSSDDVLHYLGPQKIFANHSRAVSTVHDLIPLYDTFSVDAGLRYRFPRMIERQLRHSDAVVCPSQWVADTVYERFPWYQGPVTVTPLAAGSRFRPTELSSAVRLRYNLPERYMVFVGRIDVARKNLDVILSAWLSLDRNTRSGSQFLVITDRTDADVQRFLHDHKLEVDSSVRFLTSVTTEEMVEILSNARAMVFASQAEGFGLPILEAMQCGCPVITSNATSMPEVGGDAALYVSPSNMEEVRSSMQMVLGSESVYGDLKIKGLTRSKQFSWGTTAELTVQAYRSCPHR